LPQIPEKLQFEAQIISIGSESNDLYMSLDMVFLDNKINLNSVRFTDDFLYDVEINKLDYIGLPLVGDQKAITEGNYDKLTHKYNKKTGSFSTQALGSFVDFRTEKDGDTVKLIASARIWKRFPNVCAAIEEMFNSDSGLKFSYECYVTNYTVESGVKIVDKDEANTIISSCLVSNPANPNSVGVLLVAEAMEADIDNMNLGGDVLERDKNLTQEQFFANTKIHFISELDISQVQRKVFNKLKAELKDTYWEYDSTDMGVNYLIMKNYNTADLLRVDFTVGEDDITITEMYAVDKTYTRKKSKEDDEMATIAELEVKVKDLETQIASKDTIITDKDKLIAEKETALTTKDTELTTANEKISTLSASVLEKDKEIETLQAANTELDTIKAEQEKVVKAEKKEALKTKYSKLLSAEIMKEEAIVAAIENLDESVLKDKVTELALAAAEKDQKKSKKPELASRITDNIELSGTEPDSLRAKYGI
jgi:uncharacterized coiled-coil protein SlyX